MWFSPTLLPDWSPSAQSGLLPRFGGELLLLASMSFLEFPRPMGSALALESNTNKVKLITNQGTNSTSKPARRLGPRPEGKALPDIADWSGFSMNSATFCMHGESVFACALGAGPAFAILRLFDSASGVAGTPPLAHSARPGPSPSMRAAVPGSVVSLPCRRHALPSQPASLAFFGTWVVELVSPLGFWCSVRKHRLDALGRASLALCTAMHLHIHVPWSEFPAPTALLEVRNCPRFWCGTE